VFARQSNSSPMVTAIGLSTTPRVEYFWREMSANNSSVPVWADSGAGQLIEKVTLPGSHRIDNTFNSLGLLTDTSLKTSGGTLRNQHGYVHDAAHRRTMGSRTNSTATFTANDLNQMTAFLSHTQPSIASS